MEQWEKQKQQSERLSQKYIIPFLNDHLFNKYHRKDCFVRSVESLGESLANTLDMSSGVDLYYRKGHLCYFIAQRISPKSSIDEFTIRYRKVSGAKTEFIKRIEAMDADAVRPRWNIHSHINGRQLKIGIVESDKLFRYLREQEQKGLLDIRDSYDSQYIRVPWDELNQANIPVAVLAKQFEQPLV